MRSLALVVCLLSGLSMSFAATGPGVAKAYADRSGRVHIVTADGRDHVIQESKWQAGGGFEKVTIAPDGRTVGWLADQMLTPDGGMTSYAYPVAAEVQIWRDGRVIRRFSPEALTIQNWIFVQGGSEVAYHAAPPHGIEYYDCTLFDVNTGRRVAHWSLDRKDYVVPEWAKALLVNDPLPGPDEMSKYLQNLTVAPENHSPPQQR